MNITLSDKKHVAIVLSITLFATFSFSLLKFIYLLFYVNFDIMFAIKHFGYFIIIALFSLVGLLISFLFNQSEKGIKSKLKFLAISTLISYLLSLFIYIKPFEFSFNIKTNVEYTLIFVLCLTIGFYIKNLPILGNYYRYDYELKPLIKNYRMLVLGSIFLSFITFFISLTSNGLVFELIYQKSLVLTMFIIYFTIEKNLYQNNQLNFKHLYIYIISSFVFILFNGLLSIALVNNFDTLKEFYYKYYYVINYISTLFGFFALAATMYTLMVIFKDNALINVICALFLSLNFMNAISLDFIILIMHYLNPSLSYGQTIVHINQMNQLSLIISYFVVFILFINFGINKLIIVHPFFRIYMYFTNYIDHSFFKNQTIIYINSFLFNTTLLISYLCILNFAVKKIKKDNEVKPLTIETTY